MKNVGLVLEGGGMRGLYTCGILDYFMDMDLYFKYIIGVSAGACNAVSYISKQKGRSKKVNIDFVGDKRYMSFRNLIIDKSFFGMDFMFEEIPNKYVPFDFKAFEEAECRLLTGATDCNTGKAIYFEKSDLKEGFHGLRASASLPFISPIVNFKGYELLDGGIADSIPIIRAQKDGNKKNVVILTRDKNYRKTPMKYSRIIELKYKKYPKLVEAMINRHNNYNNTLDYIEKLESQGEVIVIRPSQEVKVSRLERNPQTLNALYNNGYEDAKNNFENIMEFISQA